MFVLRGRWGGGGEGRGGLQSVKGSCVFGRFKKKKIHGSRIKNLYIDKLLSDF